MTRRGRVYKARNCLERVDSGVEWRVTTLLSPLRRDLRTLSEEGRLPPKGCDTAFCCCCCSSSFFNSILLRLHVVRVKPASASPGFDRKTNPLVQQRHIELQSEILVNSIRVPLFFIHLETKQGSVSWLLLKLRQKSAAFPWGTSFFFFFNTNQLLLFEIFCFMNTFISLFYPLFQGEPGLQPAVGWSHISLLPSSAYILLASSLKHSQEKATEEDGKVEQWKQRKAVERLPQCSHCTFITTGILHKHTQGKALKTFFPAFPFHNKTRGGPVIGKGAAVAQEVQQVVQ